MSVRKVQDRIRRAHSYATKLMMSEATNGPSMLPDDTYQTEPSAWNSFRRRSFLSQAASIVGAGWASTTIMTTSISPAYASASAPGDMAINNRRVGGLANKIRGICRTMVRSKQLD